VGETVDQVTKKGGKTWTKRKGEDIEAGKGSAWEEESMKHRAYLVNAEGRESR